MEEKIFWKIVKQRFLKQTFLKKGWLGFAHIRSTCGPDLPRARHTLRFDGQFRQGLPRKKVRCAVTNQLILFLSSAFWGPPTADVIYGSPPSTHWPRSLVTPTSLEGRWIHFSLCSKIWTRQSDKDDFSYRKIPDKGRQARFLCNQEFGVGLTWKIKKT